MGVKGNSLKAVRCEVKGFLKIHKENNPSRLGKGKLPNSDSILRNCLAESGQRIYENEGNSIESLRAQMYQRNNFKKKKKQQNNWRRIKESIN